ncbi:aminopeptidase [Terrilactibacillus sp. S3-3]|nr:aminopeptidase [Terrilactibacillus sp. S3-3]
MTVTFEQKFDHYAELTVKIGANVQKGQEVIIKAPVDAARLVRLVTEKAYQSGAKRVYYNWTDDKLDFLRLKHAPGEAIKEYPAWEAEGLETLVKRGAACIDIRPPELDSLKGIDPERVALDKRVTWEALDTYYDYRMADRVSWTIVAYPTAEWAKKLFPEEPVEQAIGKLWDIIF